MPTIETYSDKNCTINVNRLGDVHLQFWKEDDTLAFDYLCTASEWLKMIASTIDLMDKKNWEEMMKELRQ